MDWVGIAISTLFAIFHGLKTALFTVLRLVLALVHLAIYPISVLWNILVFFLTPVIHVFRFIFSPLFFLVNNFPRLQPIYIYFGSAAFVGVAFGLIFTLTSTSIVSILGLYDKPDHQEKEKSPYAKPSPSPSPYIGDEDQEHYRQTGTPPLSLAEIEQESLETLLANLDSPDSDLGSLARQGWRDSPNTKRKRRSAAASRITTILEEDDDSL
ncbi:hypothetical protein VP1G_06102 [Cytospora mali]|uniref:Uncharacterized protein n=1 Tax=Cytospora mali TaxID=578113 RepID=A0A194V4G5_CYTMA|nr:hypothetical protein VP1G_06102 [Valsa mali var. pyri (nom. inval.)]